MKQSGMLLVSFALPMDLQAYQAKAPMSETNLSSSELPAHDSKEQKMTVPARKTFFCHFTDGLCLPDLLNRPFSMILTAGKSCRGIDRRMAMESACQLTISGHLEAAHRGIELPVQTCLLEEG